MSKTLSMPFDLKEELRFRMADLEKKLAESEEERSKMEQTCKALMRSFREQERMRYIILNKKYEKFLQDCTVRKRRNETILRSLCRIEDRSKALYAKTERLKLLKNRYIAYLKISDVRKDEFSSLTQKTIDDVVPKSVHWKIPLATDENLEKIEDSLRNRASDVVSGVPISSMTSTSFEKNEQRRPEKIKGHEGRKDSEKIESNETSLAEVPENKLNQFGIGSDFSESLADSLSVRLKNEKLFRGDKQNKPEDDWVLEHDTSNGYMNNKNFSVSSGSVMGQQESVDKLKESLLLEEDYFDNENSKNRRDSNDGKAVEKNDTESNEKDALTKESNLEDKPTPGISHRFVPFQSIDDTHDEEKEEDMSKKTETEMETHHQMEETSKSLPMGLDGIDYHNETYPESYYEQPVYHHNHTNIAVDVILEEDETEQNVEEAEEEEEKKDDAREDDRGSSIWVHSPGNRILNESNLKSSSNKGYATDANGFDGQVKSQKSDSENSSVAEQSDLGTDESKRCKKESSASDRSPLSPKKSKSPVKSNLIHLLESDSESYQIEHGDGVSENEYERYKEIEDELSAVSENVRNDSQP